MYSFNGASQQGKLYLTVDEKVESYDLFVNNQKIETREMKNGILNETIHFVAASTHLPFTIDLFIQNLFALSSQ